MPIVAQARDVDMLPPQDFNGNVCSGQTAGILYWDGTTAIKCIPGANGDSNGNLQVAGSLQVGFNIAACTAALAGAIRYNSGAFEGCNGTAWTALNTLPQPDYDTSLISLPCNSTTTITHNLGTMTFKLVQVTGLSPSGNFPTEGYFNGSIDRVNDQTGDVPAQPVTLIHTYGWAWELRPTDPNHADIWVSDIDNTDCTTHVKIWK